MMNIMYLQNNKNTQPVIELAIQDKQTKITGGGLISHGRLARESLPHRANLTAGANPFYLAGRSAKEPLRAFLNVPNLPGPESHDFRRFLR